MPFYISGVGIDHPAHCFLLYIILLIFDKLKNLLRLLRPRQESFCFAQKKALIQKGIYKEHQNILTAKQDQDLSVNLPSGSRQGRLLLDPFKINYTVI